ncbi:hypothetical protein BGX28_005530 [Mortierella sp. GBA30]|nr:hypothetical protein BGX28_005530 [Mortierella sp. GBA30]
MAKNKQRKVESDSEGSTVGTTTSKMSKMKVNSVAKLPVVREIQLINSATFDPKKLKLDDEEESGGVSRVALLYKYKNGERGLCFTCPRLVDAYLRCNGVEEETYAKKGGQRTGTGKNVLKLYMDGDNPHHEQFYESLLSICAVVKKKIEKEGGEKVDVAIRGLYNLIDDEKNVTGHALSARLIESGDGVVYTAAYNDEEQVDVKSIGRCVARPGLTFSYTIPEEGGTYRINVSVAQMYYVAKSLFPLRDLE